MTKQTKIVGLGSFIFLGILLYKFFLLDSPKILSKNLELPKIGICQVISHPALDLNVQGIRKELENQGFKEGDTVQVVIEQAQGNSALANQIIQKLIAQNVKVIIAVGTMPSQVALQSVQTSLSSIPIVFTSVTDPIGSKLVDPKTLKNSSINGVSNYVSAKRQFEAFLKIMPKLQTLGIIYNPGEAFSVFLKEDMEKAAVSLQLKLIFVAAARTTEVSSAAQSIISKVDAIFVNNDNNALAAFDSIVQVAEQAHKPVFSSDLECLEKGALASLGANQSELGKQTAQLVCALLRKERQVNDFVLQYPHEIQFLVNEKVAQRY
jgi:putative ABC transport system substrate-binding protein